MNKELEEQLIKSVENVLEPINAKFLSFGVPLTMYSVIRESGDTRSIISDENKTVFYHMNLLTKYGELTMSFDSNSLDKDLKYALLISCGYSFAIRNSISKEEFREINSRILDLYRQ